jgi:hypothetical protein
MNETSPFFNYVNSSPFVHYSPSINDGSVLPLFHINLVSPSSENTEFNIYTETPPNDIAACPDRAPLQSMLLQINPTAPLAFRRERSPRETSLKNHTDIKRARFRGENHISPVQLFEKKQVCTIDNNEILSFLSFEEEATPEIPAVDVATVTPSSSPTKELDEVPTHRHAPPMIGTHRHAPPMIGIIDDYEMLVKQNHRSKQRRDRNHALCSSEFHPILDQVFAPVEAN